MFLNPRRYFVDFFALWRLRKHGIEMDWMILGFTSAGKILQEQPKQKCGQYVINMAVYGASVPDHI